MPKKVEQIKPPAFVVGLGASAGGLEALERFFDGAPIDADGAYLVVMHLSRDFKSMLDELLARHTELEVRAGIDGELIRPNTVYVIQTGTILEVEKHKLKVEKRPGVEPAGPVTSIDTLFYSIAKHWGERGAGVVLSGSGSDGAKGIRAIREAGGYACAQSPETAKFDSMPVAAIATQAVHAVDSPDQLGPIVVEGLLLPKIQDPQQKEREQESALSRVLRLVVGVGDIDVSQYKNSTFERRIQRRMMELDLNDISEYADLLETDEREGHILAQSLLIGVTRFFRDEEAFQALAETVIPKLVDQARTEKRPLRVWVAACASGEEAYTLAILFAEANRDLTDPVDVQIFATDIKREHLDAAARGEYGADQLKHVPEVLRDRYFVQDGMQSRYTIDSSVRKMIVFAPHDVLRDPPFTRLDLVSCRNLLIYFSIEAQQKVLGSFAFALNEQGVLFLGSSETVGGTREAFDFINARNRIFRRTTAKASNLTMRSGTEHAARSVMMASPRRNARHRENALQPVYSALLDSYAPSSLLVSPERELLHTFGKARAYLRPPEGVTHLDVTDMVDEALRTAMIAGIERAAKDEKAITFARLELVSFPEVGKIVDLTVRPIGPNDGAGSGHFLVIIDDHQILPNTDVSPSLVLDPSEFADERIKRLEEELDRTREALQSTMEEFETTNEELQASNEELMASNEELQSTNEELSSVNEELYSVNSEYHRQNDELSKLGEDFDRLLELTEIGVIFLDDDRRVSRFTSLAAELFNLTESDEGRALSTFRSPFLDADADTLLSAAFESSDITEQEAQDRNGRTWLIRAVSYSGQRSAVLTLINITRLREAETQARRTTQILESIRFASKAFFIEFAEDFSVILDEVGFYEYAGMDLRSSPQELDFSKVHDEDMVTLSNLVNSAPKSGELDGTIRIWNEETQRFRYVHAHGRRTETGNWAITGIDVDDFAKTEIVSQNNEAFLSALLESSPSQIGYIGKDETYRYVNEAYVRQWGEEGETFIGKHVGDVLPPELYQSVAPNIKSALEGKRQTFSVNTVTPVGEAQLLNVDYAPVRAGDGPVLGMLVDVLDVSRYASPLTEMEANDRLLSTASKFSKYPVLVVDADTGLCDYANDAALKLMGLPLGEGVPNGLHVSRLTPEWGESTWADVFTSIDLGTDTCRNDVVLFSGEGGTSIADVFIAMVEFNGRRRAIIRALENAERAALLSDLRMRSRQLAISNRDLEQFAAAVAHDLRAPLRHIISFSSLLEDELGEDLDGAPREYLDLLTKSAGSLTGMVEGLLGYVRIGLKSRTFEPVDLSVPISAAIGPFEEQVKQSGGEIVIDAHQSISGDEALLRQLFQNLVANSVKYSRPGEPINVDITANAEGRNVVLTVTDNGIGVNAERSEQMFRLFGRLHTEEEFPGLGVGLATARRICELHRGRIELDGEFEGGARFRLTFPAA